MQITKVSLSLVQESTNVKAIGNIVIDDVFLVSGLKVVQGSNGLFIAMPSRKNKDGKFVDIAYPLTAETRKKIEDLVLEEYNKIKEK